MITRNGICYNLSYSPYKYKLNDTIYIFSSKSHLDKFKNKYKMNREIINNSLSKRFKINMSLENIPDLILYMKIETRGFMIINQNGEVIQCLKNIKLGGEKMI